MPDTIYETSQVARVILELDHVTVTDEEGVEVIRWTEPEWLADPDILVTIVAAATVATTQGLDAVFALDPAYQAHYEACRAIGKRWVLDDAL